jgi:GT2 family glycosyltransferase
MPNINSEPKPLVSVITLNWNGKHYLEKLLPLLEKQTYPKDRYEIIVVDNNSLKDDSVNYVKTTFPRVKLIENKTNDGFAGGCNLGMLNANGKYFVLLNNDTQPKLNWLDELVECAEKEKNTGAVVSKVLFANVGKGNIINNAGSILHPNRPWPVEEIGANKPDGPEYSQVREITALCGTSLLLSQKMLEEVGLFDESFFMYFEDTDLSWRGQKLGWKFYYSPASVVLHEHSGSSVEHSDFWTFYVTRNRLLIMWKHAKMLLAFRVYAAFIREFILIPTVKGLLGRERRHQLHMLKLGLKINFSFLRYLGLVLLKRFNILHDRGLIK